MAFCSIREGRGSEDPVGGATLVKSLISCCIEEAGSEEETSSRSLRSLAGRTRALDSVLPHSTTRRRLFPLAFLPVGTLTSVRGGRQECSVGSQKVKQDLGLRLASVESTISPRGVRG